MKRLDRICKVWGVLVLPILAAIWWLNGHGTAGQQELFTRVVLLYLAGAVILVLLQGCRWICRFFRGRR